MKVDLLLHPMSCLLVPALMICRPSDFSTCLYMLPFSVTYTVSITSISRIDSANKNTSVDVFVLMEMRTEITTNCDIRPAIVAC